MKTTVKKVINLNDAAQVALHKKKLDDKMRKLATQRRLLEEYEKDKIAKEKMEAMKQAKALIKNYKHLPPVSKFKNEEEMLDLIRVDQALKVHFKKYYSFVGDVFIGWLDTRCNDKALYFKFKPKTADIKLFVQFTNEIDMQYKRIIEIAKPYFECCRADDSDLMIWAGNNG